MARLDWLSEGILMLFTRSLFSETSIFLGTLKLVVDGSGWRGCSTGAGGSGIGADGVFVEAVITTGVFTDSFSVLLVALLLTAMDKFLMFLLGLDSSGAGFWWRVFSDIVIMCWYGCCYYCGS